MTLFTKTQTEQLIANCQAQIVRMNSEQLDIDFVPVVKLFTPDAQCTWQYSSSAGAVRVSVPSPGTGESGARARLASRTPSVATSL